MPSIPPLKADFFKALAHPLRIRILEILSSGERSVGQLQGELAAEQSLVSQQLGILRRAGAVTSRREGSSVHYSLADERMSDLLDISRAILIDAATQARRELEEA